MPSGSNNTANTSCFTKCILEHSALGSSRLGSSTCIARLYACVLLRDKSTNTTGSAVKPSIDARVAERGRTTLTSHQPSRAALINGFLVDVLKFAQALSER